MTCDGCTQCSKIQILQLSEGQNSAVSSSMKSTGGGQGGRQAHPNINHITTKKMLARTSEQFKRFKHVVEEFAVILIIRRIRTSPEALSKNKISSCNNRDFAGSF